MFYHHGSRQLQDRFGTRKLADRIEQRLVKGELDNEARAFVESRDMFFVATVDDRGLPSCSYKGGHPGFVRAIDPKTIVFPNYDGNGMYVSTGNVMVNPHVGLLFIDFEDPGRLRVGGVAENIFEGPLLDGYPGAQFVVKVTVREVFINCARYIHRLQLVKRSANVPRHDGWAPPADWKRQPEFADALPLGDPAAPKP